MTNTALHHDHEHGHNHHEHEQNLEHEHNLNHHHDCTGLESMDKLTALLEHMYHHNDSHTKELAGIKEALIKNGKEDVAAKVDEAIAQYTKGNEILHEALHSLS